MVAPRELIAAIGQRYRSRSSDERRRILDEFVCLIGYHRKHAIWASPDFPDTTLRLSSPAVRTLLG